MALTQGQIEDVKSQLRQQIKHLPEEKRKEAEKQIDSLSEQAIEELIKQQHSGESSNKGIFRRIIDKEIPSKIIDENSLCIAVLDIKPISKGHVIIIPKKAVSNAKELPPKAFSLARKIAKRISSKLKAKGMEIQTEFKFGEAIINLIPIYEKGLSINSPREDASEKELEEIHKILKIIKKPRQKKPEAKKPALQQIILKKGMRIP